MLNKFVRIFGGDPNKKEVEKYSHVVDQINAFEEEFAALSQDELRIKTSEFRARLAKGETLDDIMLEAFAVVREASKRTLGLRHYDVQLIGGIALHQGKIAEMRTGEGKTLVATLPIYLNALTGKGVHLITVNDYLARRDARWMAPIYNLLGLSVGVLQMASRTENGKKAFLIDLERESPHEDQHQLRMVNRSEAYGADITYGTNSEFGFDYLRDNMTMSLEERVQRGHYYAIIDEVDNVLIDEARTPLIISGPAQEDTEWYIKMAQIVKKLRAEDFEISERDRNITLTEIGEMHVEELLEMPLRDPDLPEDVTPEQARIMGYLEQALRAQYLFHRNKDYLVQGGKVVIVDEFTGRLMPGRRWSDGLHQAVEAKEGVRVQAENVTYATITIQNYFRMYEKLSGMTGTALTEAEEFDKIYKLGVLAIPTNLEYQAAHSDSPLEELDGRDEQGYKYRYYARMDDTEKNPVYWKRKDYPDVIFLTEEAKFRAIVQEILKYHSQGRPLLVGTTSVELSERLSVRLKAEPLRRLAQILLIRNAWFKKHDREEDGRQIKELEELNQPLDQLQTSDLRRMANSVDISMNPEDQANLERLIYILGLDEADQERLVASLKAGIPNEVLNARKHTEESQIIAGAGAFGALTIATNMAGRGVDIKLGGELAEEVLTSVNRVLNRAGFSEPYNMNVEDRRQALIKLDPSDYGIYESEIKYFLQQIEDMERVKSRGGLHVIGSERHEARRIDNQLRGRAARQGDPGSSRFYLSLEDDLMRRFGGQQANDMMQRLRVDEALPIEIGLVGRLVEQSQTRVEGANFDVRKHLLEYDDVLNTQRSKIYAQRNRIFIKKDLSEDVTDMLRTEVLARVPKALKDEEGPWSLLAWLDQIQPPLPVNGQVVPTFTIGLLVDMVKSQINSGDGQQSEFNALMFIAEQSLISENEHLLKAVDNLLDQFQERLESQLAERQEAIDTFFEGLTLADETDVRQPKELVDEISSLSRVPLRLTNEQQRALRNSPQEVVEIIREQIESTLASQAVTRLIGAIERRLGESLNFTTNQLDNNDWDALSEEIYSAVASYLDRRKERLIGTGASDNGQEPVYDGMIAKDLESAQAREKLRLSDMDKDKVIQAVEGVLTESNGAGQSQERSQIFKGMKTTLAKFEGLLDEDDQDYLLEQAADVFESQDEPGQPDFPGGIIDVIRKGLDEIEESHEESRLATLLMHLPLGTQTTFDRKTHRRVQTRTIRFSYTYYASSQLHDQMPEEIAEDVLEHLEEAQAAMRHAWGRLEWNRLTNTAPNDLSELVQQGLQSIIGEDLYSSIEETPLGQAHPELKGKLVDELGRQALTEVYRQLLLGVITELWVDYLTQMEALRVAIGLEAYGQRDPLVQYKTRAYGLFQTLLSNMRLGVITRMFTYRPRDMSSMQTITIRRAKDEAALPEGDGDGSVSETSAADGDQTAKKPSKLESKASKTQQTAPREKQKPDRQKLSKSQRRRRARR
jgi:preprotein translocase subunit SecA